MLFCLVEVLKLSVKLILQEPGQTVFLYMSPLNSLKATAEQCTYVTYLSHV